MLWVGFRLNKVMSKSLNALQMFKYILSLLFGKRKPQKPRDTIYGEEAIACRDEIHAIKREHYRLLRAKASYEDVQKNIDKFDDVEQRYFG